MADHKLTNRDKQAIATKKRIYKKGMSLIQKHGIDGVSVNQIADAAGVSVGTFYHYYTSKLDLFMDLYRTADTYYENQVSKETASLPFSDKIKLFFDEYCSLAEDNGIELTGKMFVPDNHLFLSRSNGMHKVLSDIVDAQAEEGWRSTDKTTDDVCDDLFLIARGVIFDWALREGGYDLKKKMSDMLDMYLDDLL